MKNNNSPELEGAKKQESRITKGGIDSDRMQKLICAGVDKLKSIHEKEGVIVIGNTGAGKSTTINYMLGGKMKKRTSTWDGNCRTR